MLGVVIIAVVFTALAVAIGYGAMKGKLSGFSKAVETDTPSGRRILNLSLIFTYVAFGLAVPIIFVVGNRTHSNAQVGGIKLTAAMQSGRELFGTHCAVCHTLAATNAVGKIGPNLDVLKPTPDIVRYAIRYGCLQQPAKGSSTGICLGFGTMPANIVQGQDAEDIAQFVSKVAGHV